MKYPYEYLKDLKYKEEQVNLFNKWVINNKIAKQIYTGNYWTNLLQNITQKVRRHNYERYRVVYENLEPGLWLFSR